MSEINISRQKLDIDEAIAHLRRQKSEIEHKIQVLSRGIEALDQGENILDSNSILASEVRRIMRTLIHQ